MEGVAEVAAEQAAAVAAEQAAIAARVQADRDALESALSARLSDSVQSMDDLVAELQSSLRSRQAAAEGSVDADRIDETEAIRTLRAELLEKIKALVWKLGYQDDGLDYEDYDYSVAGEHQPHGYGYAQTKDH